MTNDKAYAPLYLKGIEHFNDFEFFEAHDAWEELWTEHTGADRTFYQGLIQMAVCLHHFGNGNIRGARKLYRTSRKYLSEYLPNYMGIDLAQIFEELERCCSAFLLEADEQPPAFEPDIAIDADLIPHIRLQPFVAPDA